MVRPPKSASEQGRRARLRPDERRAQIIAVAREVFVESGFDTTRVKDIAGRAGITEAYLFRFFPTKADLFRAAVEEPLMRFVRQLDAETMQLKELAARQRPDRADLLRRFHIILLTRMLDIAPLMAAAMFSNGTAGREIYSDFLLPRVNETVGRVIEDLTAWPVQSFQLDLLVQAFVGVHMGIAADQLMDQRPIDVAHVAEQLTLMFAPRRPKVGA
jgi:AcrR family transcriptional regulator